MKSWKRTRSGWRSPSAPRKIRPDCTSPNIPQPKFMANPKPLSLRTELRNNDDQLTVSIEHTGSTEHCSTECGGTECGGTECGGTECGGTEHGNSPGAQTAQRAYPCGFVQHFRFLRRSCLDRRNHCIHWQALRDGNRRAESIHAEWQAVFEDRNTAGGVRGDRRQAGSRRNTGKEVVGIGKQVYLSLLTSQHFVTETM